MRTNSIHNKLRVKLHIQNLMTCHKIGPNKTLSLCPIIRTLGVTEASDSLRILGHQHGINS